MKTLPFSAAPNLRLRRRSRQRGIASIEAAIMLPLLIIVFAGVLYVEKLVSTTQHATRTARTCAWRAAVSACEQIPPECPESTAEGDSSVKSRLAEAGVPSSLDVDQIANEESAPKDDRVDNVLADIGARINEFFLDRYEAQIEGEFEKSKILGGETVTISQSFSLPCNIRPGTAEGLADTLFNEFSPPEKTPEPERLKDPE